MDPTLVSNPVENKWADEISKRLDHQMKINREIPSVSIFHLPESITTKKPEAYEPQQIGLGPIHHFRAGTYRKMEQQKLVVAGKELKETKVEDAKPVVLDKVRQLVPIVRSCYDMFLQDDDESLVWIFVIDGLFLINLFQTYDIGKDEKKEYLGLLEEKAYEFKRIKIAKFGPESEELEEMGQTIDEFCENYSFPDPLLVPKVLIVTRKNQREFENVLNLPNQRFEKPKFGTTRRKLVQDVMMVGNQIPFLVLKEINEALHPSTGSFSSSKFRAFCKIHSPLMLCSKLQAPTNNVEHVLHYMYCSILNNYTPVETTADQPTDEPPKPPFHFDPSWFRSGHTGKLIDPINFISKIPKEEIIQVYEKTVSILETFTKTKILIPSAFNLHCKAGFVFQSLPKDRGIQNIYKNDKDIYLPCVTLNNDSEVILRNLVAYETLTANPENFPLTEFMGLMCALIVNVDDVKYLKDQKVIDGDMGNDEVVKLFVGMSTYVQPIKPKEKTSLQKMIDEVNSVYNVRLEMKMHLHLKKQASWVLVGLKATGKFVEDSWKTVAFMISIVTVFMLTYQAYCDVYGCDKNLVTSLPYASS